MLFENLSSIHEIVEVVGDGESPLPAYGEYHLIDRDGWIAVSTLASPELASELAERKPVGVCITGKLETENIGIEKVVRNVLALPFITYLVICGQESDGHFSGDGLVSLVRNGVDGDMKVIGARGRKCILKNLTIDEVLEFRSRVELIDMTGCMDIDLIISRIGELKVMYKTSSIKGRGNIHENIGVERVVAGEKDPYQVKLDRLGYFVILPLADKGSIVVEHYGNDNVLLHVIEGKSARNIYWTIIEKGWISELSHGAYLGKELTRAELSIVHGFQYIQDKA